MRYQGGLFAPYTCEYFSMQVTVPLKGTYPVRVVTRQANGKVAIDSESDPLVAQNPLFSSVIYAGTTPPQPSNGSGTPLLLYAGVAVIGAGLGLAGFRLWRGRAEPENDREEELQARVDEVKKRTSARREPD